MAPPAVAPTWRRRVVVDRAIVAAFVVVAIWAANIVVVKWAVRQWQPLAYSFDRYAIGTILFAAWVLFREGSLRVARADLPVMVLAAAIGIAANQLCLMYGARYAPAVTLSLLMATSPAFAAVFAVALGQERVSRRQWLGIGVSSIGVVLVLHGSGAKLDLGSVRGDLLGLGMAASWAAYGVLLRPLMGRYSASRLSAVVFLLGTPMIFVAGAGQVVGQDYGSLTAGAWAALVFSLVFSLFLTNILWFSAIHRAGAARVTSTLTIQPFIGALLAMVFLGEVLSAEQWLGGAVVVGGLAAARRRIATPAPGD